MAQTPACFRSHLIATGVSVLALVFAITSTSLESMITSEGLAFGLSVKTERGIFLSKRQTTVAGVSGQHVQEWFEQCDGYNQSTDCGSARLDKCNVNKTFVCFGCFLNFLSVILCLLNTRPGAIATSIAAIVMYMIVIGVTSSLRYSSSSDRDTTNADCGYGNATDYPNVKFGAAFYLLVVAICLCAIVSTLMATWTRDDEYDATRSRKIQVYPLMSTSPPQHQPNGNANDISLVSTMPPTKPQFPTLPSSLPSRH
eukprot:m.176983 g.176983  ORF g.176983 m.176983 type:complete len:256 (+) comp31867_c0_seq3:318-1085(+)